MRPCVAAVLLLALGGLAACTDADEPRRPTVRATVSPTPLSEFDTTSVVVTRAAFCDLVPPTAAALALGAPVTATDEYANGERATLTTGVRDIAHEFSCSWSTQDGSTARAWVFAPRVTEKAARRWVVALRGQKRCRIPQAPGFGDPSVATLCTTGSGTEAAFQGLFVDAWLSCSLSSQSPRKDLLDRAGQWCVQVARSVDASG
jgi:hypothetical protein